MSEEWDYQVRATISSEFAEDARAGCSHPDLAELARILETHNTVLKCQYDAFADYVAEAEAHGPENYPLYAWTKSTIEDPVKKDKYLKSFTFYVAGQEVYPKHQADPLVEDLRPLAGGPVIANLKIYDTNPANNPQPPQPNEE